jgi:polyisoprenyl-teichoic acid--peptidoglycan teichoic acid transferase
MSDERPDQPREPDSQAPSDGIEEPTEVQPATWAGRRAAEPDADGAPDEEPSAADESEEPPDEFEFGDDDEDDPDDDLDEDEEDDLDEDEDGLSAGEASSGAPVGAGDATIEADTLAIGDREEAREAAMAGLRARAAEHAAKRDGPQGQTVAEPEAPAAAAAAEEDAEPEPETSTDGDGTGVAGPEPEPDEAGGAPRRTLWARFVAAGFLIVVSMATATAVSLLVYLTDIAKGLGGLEGLTPNLSEVEAGKPQNFLILGSDRRPGEGDRGRSDTTMLLRIDPDNQISLMSIPRDLKVNIPGYGVEHKFNEAYTLGGPKLTLKVVQQLTENRIPINHVVNVDFLGFADAVNTIDCVYIDVDHHYYHSNEGIAPGSESYYSEIDIPAGYQRLCGLKALQYVRYRHDDNDLVRAARQQDFLREARQKVPGFELLNKSKELIDVFTKYTTSDISSPVTLLNLLKLLYAARNEPVVQIHFPATLGGPTAAYVTASNEQIQNTVTQFLNPGGGESNGGKPEPTAGGGSGGGDGGSGSGGGGEPAQPPPPELIDSSAMGQEYAARIQATKTKGGKPMVNFPIYYPTLLAPGSQFSDDSRAFPIDGPGDDVYYGYKLAVSIPGVSFPTAYYGVSGTDWRDPPILANPSEERVVDGRNYLLFFDGGRLRQVGWKTSKASYWVTNTLTQQLDEGQMLGIAQSLREFG